MKIIVSSKALGNKLKQIKFSQTEVYEVQISDGLMSIFTTEKVVRIAVEPIEKTTQVVSQKGTKWDWLRQVLLCVTDQPVVLEISEYRVRLSFDF